MGVGLRATDRPGRFDVFRDVLMHCWFWSDEVINKNIEYNLPYSIINHHQSSLVHSQCHCKWYFAATCEFGRYCDLRPVCGLWSESDEVWEVCCTTCGRILHCDDANWLHKQIWWPVLAVTHCSVFRVTVCTVRDCITFRQTQSCFHNLFLRECCVCIL